MVSKAEGIELNDLLNVNDYLLPIFPESGETITLPIRFIVAEDVATGISIAFNRLLNSDIVQHFDIPS